MIVARVAANQPGITLSNEFLKNLQNLAIDLTIRGIAETIADKAIVSNVPTVFAPAATKPVVQIPNADIITKIIITGYNHEIAPIKITLDKYEIKVLNKYNIIICIPPFLNKKRPNSI